MALDLVQRLNNRINGAIKNLSFLKPSEVVHVQTTVSLKIKEFVAEKGDPFKELTKALGPTFDQITQHEKNLEHLLDEYSEKATGFGKMVKNGGVYPTLTVRGNSRLVIKELKEGQVLRKEVYRSKRGEECSICKGTGVEGTIPGQTRKCRNCKGKGKVYPLRGILLEVIK